MEVLIILIFIVIVGPYILAGAFMALMAGFVAITYPLVKFVESVKGQVTK